MDGGVQAGARQLYLLRQYKSVKMRTFYSFSKLALVGPTKKYRYLNMGQ